MSSHDDERRTRSREGKTPETLGPDEGRFVEALAESYAPEPMTPARRVAFDDALQARIARRPSSWTPSSWTPSSWKPRAALWLPAAAAAALAAVWLFSVGPDPGSAPSVAHSIDAEAWEEALLAPDFMADLESSEDDDEVLPEDYLAIASAFL